jgi:hypothetical protein
MPDDHPDQHVDRHALTGMNSGNMNEAMNSTEISGTPRISST